MVQPLPPPPRKHRGKTRLSRCRAREESKHRSVDLAKANNNGHTKNQEAENQSSWVKFDSTEIKSSWAGHSVTGVDREAVEVEIRDASSTASLRNQRTSWATQPIDDSMVNLPAIPAPSSLSSTRDQRSVYITPLQQRDTNTATIVSNNDTKKDSKCGARKVVARPTQISLDRNGNNQLRARSRSRRPSGRSSSIIRSKSIERKPRDSSVNSGISRKKEIVMPRSRPRRERSLSIVRASRSKSTISKRSRSLSIATSRSSEAAKIKNTRNLNNNDDSNVPPRQASNISSRPDEETIIQRDRDDNNSARLEQAEFAPPVHREAFSNMPGNFVSLPRPIYTRNLLTSSVYNNEATGIWITTINMNQKSNVTKNNAAKYLKAFSFHSEREARESAYANAPAKMMPFDENPTCFMCDTKFTVLRRASHCRNCGVCICNSCSIHWHKLSLPETYNVKNESSMRVCKSCDTLSKQFRKALHDADYNAALIVYNTGNINLRCQFMSIKGSEAMLPIHCATEGGSLKLLQWLVDVHYCPIKRVRTSNRYKNQTNDELITTSKGRSLLEIAMSCQNVDILNYLVNVKQIGFESIKSLDVALKALEAVILAFPRRDDEEQEEQSESGIITPVHGHKSPSLTFEVERSNRTPIRDGIPLYEMKSFDSDDESTDSSSNRSAEQYANSDDEESVATTVHDAVSL